MLLTLFLVTLKQSNILVQSTLQLLSKTTQNKQIQRNKQIDTMLSLSFLLLLHLLLVYYRTQVQSLPSLVSHQSVALLSWVELLQIVGFVKILTWISLSCNMGLSKFFSPNKTKLKVDQKAYWSFCFDIKVLNKSGYSMPWVHSAFGNVFLQIFSSGIAKVAHLTRIATRWSPSMLTFSGVYDS